MGILDKLVSIQDNRVYQKWENGGKIARASVGRINKLLLLREKCSIRGGNNDVCCERHPFDSGSAFYWLLFPSLAAG